MNAYIPYKRTVKIWRLHPCVDDSGFNTITTYQFQGTCHVLNFNWLRLGSQSSVRSPVDLGTRDQTFRIATILKF